MQYSHNSSVNFNITDIGEYTYYESLICQTDKRPCCRSNRVGEWHYPNGTRVPIEGTGSDMYRNRDDDGQVRLNRRNNAIYPLGTYTCIVPDATDTIQVVHATLQYPGMLINYRVRFRDLVKLILSLSSLLTLKTYHPLLPVSLMKIVNVVMHASLACIVFLICISCPLWNKSAKAVVCIYMQRI